MLPASLHWQILCLYICNIPAAALPNCSLAIFNIFKQSHKVLKVFCGSDVTIVIFSTLLIICLMWAASCDCLKPQALNPDPSHLP